MKEQIEEMIEYLNNTINVERNSYFGKGCITVPLIEADKILTILLAARYWLTKLTRYHRWEIVIGSNGKEKMVCTNCRHQQDLASTFTYCPKCGAKMKGGAE